MLLLQRFVIVCSFLCLFCSCRNSHQTIELESEENFPLKFDVANIDLGETETHFKCSFPFCNDSEDTIDHITLLSSCGCTKMTILYLCTYSHRRKLMLNRAKVIIGILIVLTVIHVSIRWIVRMSQKALNRLHRMVNLYKIE
jgi:hypothetical protein